MSCHGTDFVIFMHVHTGVLLFAHMASILRSAKVFAKEDALPKIPAAEFCHFLQEHFKAWARSPEFRV